MSDFYRLDPDEQCQLLEQLARLALPEWGIGRDAQLKLVKHRENTIFKVTDPAAGQSFALRIHRAAYNSPDEVRSELQWMQALRKDGILTPEVVRTKDSQIIKEIKSREVPEMRTVDLFHWIEARELGRIEDGASDDPETLGRYRIVGQTAARLHNHSFAWAQPPGFTRHSWDEMGLLGEIPLWGRYWESNLLGSSQRNEVNAIRANAGRLLRQFGRASDRYGLLHADLVPENLMLAGDDVYIIDFDDMGFGWFLFDLATILYWHLGTKHYEAIYQSVIAGYRSQRALSDEMLEWFPLFLLLRGTTYIGWCHTRQDTKFAQDMGAWVICTMMDLLAAGHKQLADITAH